MLAVLHFVCDADDPAAIVAALAGPLAPGSYVAISHLTADFAPSAVSAGVEAYNTLVPTTLIPRSHSAVSALFGRLPLVPPGVVAAHRMAASHPRPAPGVRRHVCGPGPHPGYGHNHH